MIRSALLAVLLAGPAGVEGLSGQELCAAAWGKIAGLLGTLGAVRVDGVTQEGEWCVVVAPIVDIQGQYVPAWHIDRLRFRGAALRWIAEGAGLPEGLEIGIEGLRLVVQTGDARMDWLFAAQSRPNGIDAEVALAWDPSTRELRLEGLSVDFPGENLVAASATVTGVDLSSAGAMQLSATGFALAEADLRVQTHGLFEWYGLMMLGPMLLPSEGDMASAAEAIRADLLAAVAALPGSSFSDDSKAALIEELPNPSGELALALRADPGIGPGRFAGYGVAGLPTTLADVAPVFQGVTVDLDWTHADAP